MVGFYGDQQTGIPDIPDSLKYDLSQRNLGGVLLFGYNLDNPSQMIDLNNKLNSNAKTPLFIATDQEGGKVARLSSANGFSKTYTAYQLGTVFNSEDSTRAMASMMADWMQQVGINVDFAPVVDVDVDPNSPAIGHYGRSFSPFPDTVSKFAGYFIDEMNKKKIITSLKHFPGHGSAMMDSHLGFTDITNTWADSELVPYKSLLKNNYNNMIMVGHLFNAHLDSLYPASLSHKVITGLLRERLGFKGVVVSDELFMNAISDNYSFDSTITLAINAGIDILLFKKSMINNGFDDISLCDSVINIVEKQIKAGKISESTIDSAYTRIMDLKSRYLKPSKVNDKYLASLKPEEYSLSNYPNPFNPTTTLSFNLPQENNISIKIFNVTGELVKEIFKGRLNTGVHNFSFDGSNLSSGVYFAVLQTSGKLITHKLILLK